MPETRHAITPHKLLPAIATRWSPRSYATTPVTDEALRAVLDAGRWAASCFNDQPWAFVITRREDAAHAAMLACLAPFNQVWAAAAPVLIITVARLHFAHNGQPNKHAWYDVGQACASMAIEASSRAMQMHQMAGFDADAARAALHIPEGFEAASAVTLGFPGEASALPEKLAERETAPRARHAAEAVFFHGTWSKPL